MAESSIDETHHEEPEMPTAEEFVTRLFAIVMAGILGVIVLMAIAAGW